MGSVVAALVAVVPTIVWASDYQGTIGDVPIGFALDGASDYPKKSGWYFYAKYWKDIPLAGEYDEKTKVMTLREKDGSGKDFAEFRLTFPKKDPKGKFKGALTGNEVAVGTWNKIGSSESKPVYLSMTTDMPQVGNGRYSSAGATDDFAVEKQVQKFWHGLVNGKRNDVADSCEFPVRIGSVTVKSKAELLRKYDKLFTPKTIAAIKKTVPHAMFARDQGVMLGDGEAWFNDKGKLFAINDMD